MTDPRRDHRRFVTTVHVRWSDLDLFGHVNNARTLTLLEEARVDWLFDAAARAGADRLTRGVVVARLTIDYRRPIGHGRPVTVTMWLSRLASASFTIEYEVSVDEETAVLASSVLVPVDPDTARPRRLDDVERSFLRPYLPAGVDR